MTRTKPMFLLLFCFLLLPVTTFWASGCTDQQSTQSATVYSPLYYGNIGYNGHLNYYGHGYRALAYHEQTEQARKEHIENAKKFMENRRPPEKAVQHGQQPPKVTQHRVSSREFHKPSGVSKSVVKSRAGRPHPRRIGRH